MTLDIFDKRHGTTNGYNRHRCRCEACTEANRLVSEEFKRNKALERIKDKDYINVPFPSYYPYVDPNKYV